MTSKSEILEKDVHSTERFIKEINSLVENYNVELIDAIVNYCEKYNIEIEAIASIVRSNSKIKARLQCDAEDLNILPKTSRLPI